MLHNKTVSPELKEDLAAVVLYAAAMLYEWDKSRSTLTSDSEIH
jgi:hypothetical protein